MAQRHVEIAVLAQHLLLQLEHAGPLAALVGDPLEAEKGFLAPRLEREQLAEGGFRLIQATQSHGEPADARERAGLLRAQLAEGGPGGQRLIELPQALCRPRYPAMARSHVRLALAQRFERRLGLGQMSEPKQCIGAAAQQAR